MYGLARASTARLRVRGVGGEALRLVTVGSIAAIVGRVSRPHEATRANLVRYHTIEEKLGAAMTATLPARFGTTVRDITELAAILRGREETLRRALRHVSGRAQMTVRVVGPHDAPAGPAASTTLRLSRASGDRRATGRGVSGTEYLRARAAEMHNLPGFGPVRAAVARWIRDEQIEKRDRVATVYHLIPRKAAEAYTRAIRAAAARAGVHVIVSGPWATYAFTEA